MEIVYKQRVWESDLRLDGTESEAVEGGVSEVVGCCVEGGTRWRQKRRKETRRLTTDCTRVLVRESEHFASREVHSNSPQ